MKNKIIYTIALVITTSFMACQESGTSSTTTENSTKNTVALRSEVNHFISIDSANKMLNSYLISTNAPNDSNIRSYIIDAEQLREYLNDTSSERITEIKIMFAHQLSYINDGHRNVNCGYNPNGLTLIIAGVKENGDYGYYKNQVMDYATSCPTHCTTSGTSSNDTLINE